MTSGAHLGTKGVQTSSGGVAALVGPNLGLRPGRTGLLKLNGSAKPTLVRNLATLLARGGGEVCRWCQSASGRPTPRRVRESPGPVTMAQTALEHQLSRLLFDADLSVRRLRRGATLVKQGTPGSELFLLLEGSLAVEVDGERVGEVGPGAILGELAVLEHDVMVVGVMPGAAARPGRPAGHGRHPGRQPLPGGGQARPLAVRADGGDDRGLDARPTVPACPAAARYGRGAQFIRHPGPAGRRTATLRAVTSCRVAVLPDGVLDREALAELAEGRRFMPCTCGLDPAVDRYLGTTPDHQRWPPSPARRQL